MPLLSHQIGADTDLIKQIGYLLDVTDPPKCSFFVNVIESVFQ